MIRTLFTILIVLFLIASAFLAFFIVTFDADAYRPLVITKLESALGKPVELQGISLGWNDGIALKLRGLAVYPGETKAGEPVVQFDEASTLVRFFPLLQKDVEISALKLIRPSLHLLRTGAGEVILYEAKPPLKPDAGSAVPEIRPIGEVVKPAAEKPAAAPVVPPVPLLIDTVEIEDGILRFTDQTGELKQDLIINQIQITLRNVSYSRSVPFRVDLAVLSGKQNVQVEGRFRL
ncbi:MAG TPA: AsmA family protein, partial [bacterium]|nr:AsmA family protein [bacterium]